MCKRTLTEEPNRLTVSDMQGSQTRGGVLRPEVSRCCPAQKKHSTCEAIKEAVLAEIPRQMSYYLADDGLFIRVHRTRSALSSHADTIYSAFITRSECPSDSIGLELQLEEDILVGLSRILKFLSIIQQSVFNFRSLKVIIRSRSGHSINETWCV